MKLKSPGLEIAMTPAKVAITGNLKLEAEETVEVTGMDDNLT